MHIHVPYCQNVEVSRTYVQNLILCTSKSKSNSENWEDKSEQAAQNKQDSPYGKPVKRRKKVKNDIV